MAYQCILCTPGKYKSEVANNACLECPINTYLNYSGADDVNECMPCPANSITNNIWGAADITACVCKVGFYGPPGGPCTPCQTGRYADVPGQAACTQCPANQDSPLQSDEITDCACVQGYTGPNGGVCEQCALSTYKTTTGNHSCTSCEMNTMTLETGSTNNNACICNPGYSGNIIKSHSSTACARLIALTPRPAFVSVSTRNDNAISTSLPTYIPTGGPNGKGHVSFNRASSNFLDAGARTLNIASNGGLTIVTVMRFTGSPFTWERIIDFGNVGDFGNNNILIARYEGSSALKFEVFSGVAYNRVINVASGNVITQNAWLTVVLQYRASTRGWVVTVNNVVQSTGTASEAIVDRTLNAHYIAKSHFAGEGFLNADIAGLFVVDEYLSTDATTAIADAMRQGVDFTTVCVNSCTACSTGKYKVNPGPQICTDCVADTYSTATAAVANTTCLSCPANTVSAVGSGVLTSCKCNLGYTSPDGDGLACNACVPGKYKTVTGSLACTDCGLGKYSGVVAKTDSVCTDCLANENTNGTGKDERADCRCNPGYTGEDGTFCYACVPGTYKVTLGPEVCTLCSQDRYSTVTASTSGASCDACPTSSQSPPGSSAKAACICNMGYTGLGGSETLPYIAGGTFTNLLKSCGVNMNQDCTCQSSEVGAFLQYGRTCDKAFDNNVHHDNSFQSMASICDGNTYWCWFGRSSTQTQPYIMVNFGQSVDVTAVEIFSVYLATEGERWDWRPRNFDIFIGDSTTMTSNAVCATNQNFPDNTNGVYRTFGCIGRGQYLFIRQGSFYGNYLQIHEMRVPGSIPEKNRPCAACVAGTYKTTNGSAVCTNCVADTYSTVVAATSNTCVGCPMYTQSVQGSGAITKCRCNAGYTGPDGAVCTGCVAGKYKTTVGSVVCSNCAVNTFSTAVNKSDASCTTCLSVTTGPSQSLEGSALQTDCKCNMGYSGSDGSTCIACPRGAFKPSVGDATCSLCPTNTYQPALARTASADCLGCPDNSLSLEFSDELTDCECKSGYFGANGGDCTMCYAGKFKPLKGPQDCDLCPNNTYSGQFGATSDGVCASCQENSLSRAGSTVLTDCHCNSGFFTENFGEPTVFCKTCGNGTYNTQLNATACSKCAAGLYSTAIGAKTGEVCQKCLSGFSGEGYAQCDACPPHATALIASAFITDCKCDPGYTGDDGGTCYACAVGKFKPENGSRACYDCPLDTYLPYTAASFEIECVECAANSITLQVGSDTVDDCKCNVGYTSLVAGMDGEGCTACAQGKYKNTTGHHTCALCPLNTYLDATGSSLITQCQQCFESSVSDEGSPTVESCKCIGGFQRYAT